MDFTQEQQAILECDLGADDLMLVKAFAGTGKTTTLVEYARRRPRTRFLYIAFNKSVQLEGAGRFPANVTCRTAHSLAFPGFGARHKERLVPAFKANVVKEALGLPTYEQARLVIDTLVNYLASADARVDPRHVPGPASGPRASGGARVDRSELVRQANELGRLMCTAQKEEIGMVHDGYLKLYQLSGPRLPYDCIMLDETQDISPVQAAIVLDQPGTAKILVGDEHQSIYSFRGARNIMAQVRPTHRFYLTRSFRFNQSVARVANMILGELKGERRRIVGLRPKGGRPPGGGGYTLIARTNGTLFKEAVKLLGAKKKIGFVGGIAGYRINRVLDMYHLFAGRREAIRDAYIKSFEDFSAMHGYAREVEDFELTSMARVVEDYKGRIPALVEKIQAAAVDPDKARVLLTTAHKAKGLEFSTVLMADDFPALSRRGEVIPAKDLETDEINLVYVACTRAMDHLRVPKDGELAKFIGACVRSAKERGSVEVMIKPGG